MRSVNVYIFRLVLAGFVMLAASTGLPGASAPAQTLEIVFARHDRASTQRVDHKAWQAILEKYLRPDATGLNRFQYKDVSERDQRRLKAYLSYLQSVEISKFARQEQYAFWINLYNALTIDVMLAHYPVGSIRDISISPGLFSTGPWGKKLAYVAGHHLSLDDIEHEILRKLWRDKRIHYAVNCASIGCPNLALTAYTGRNIEHLLEAGAADYINHRRGVQIVRGALMVSKIYQWYARDFGSARELLDHFRRYAKAPLARRLAGIDTISGYRYDWRINQ